MDLHWASPPSTQNDRQYPAPPLPPKSPHKRHHSTIGLSDPLLSHLSTSAALEAFRVSNGVGLSSQDAFYHSISSASPSERALAVRAASAAKQLEEWLTELQQWQWPSSFNGFEPSKQPIHPNISTEPSEDIPNNTVSEATDDECPNAEEHWGSLPAKTVLQCRKRIGEVRDAMDALELDELKTHIRDIHLASTTRQSLALDPGNPDVEPSSYTQLDDFTAVITTIMMQALPVISRLEALLATWEVRLTVLCAVPGFITTMNGTQHEMTTAWTTLGDLHEDAGRPPMTRPFILGLKARLENQIRDLAQRLDHMLDILEGRQDVLPDDWLDSMERVENDFSNWVVEAEKAVVHWEINRARDRSKQDKEPLEPRVNNLPMAGSFKESELQTTPEEVPPPHNLTTGETNNHKLDKFTPLPHPNPRPETLSPEVLVHEYDGGPSPTSHRPKPLNFQHNRNHSNALSELSSEGSCPGSATSDCFSNMSSPEIQDASKTEYFGVGSPVEVTTPGFPRRKSKESDLTVSRHSSQRTERGDTHVPGFSSPARSCASTVVSEPPIREDRDGVPVRENAEPQYLPHMPVENGFQIDRIAAGLQDSSRVSPAPTKPRQQSESIKEFTPARTPVKVIRRKTTDVTHTPATTNNKSASRSATTSPTKSVDEELEARISSILTEIPVNIQLARGPDAKLDGNNSPPATRHAKLLKKAPTPRLMRSQTAVPSPPAMTLTPADPRRARAQDGEQETKLYHLHQSGKKAPIKLHVRLVGESGERVMVRIGGGWADLAEYLKEYATHHGRRTVSEGRFNIQGMPQSQSASPVTTLGSLSNHQTTPRSRPDTPLKAERSAFGAAASKTRGFSAGEAGLESTPPVAIPDYLNDVRPISRDSNASSGRSWTGDDSPSLGLAGPKSRKADVSPTKQAWVDTMMDVARSGGDEKKKKKSRHGGAFGDLGIMGGTKRLFMKREKET
ncbi:MAG: hypothetical protein Q9219_001559 [cf. Caloplaca sp. 3 TL-2023]